MTPSKKRSQYFQDLRYLHRTLAPIMLVPLVLTALTGIAYQAVDLAEKGDDFEWLLDVHKGHFGILNLESIYPFLNALGLFALVFTEISLWFNMRRASKKRST